MCLDSLFVSCVFFFANEMRDGGKRSDIVIIIADFIFRLVSFLGRVAEQLMNEKKKIQYTFKNHMFNMLTANC